MIQTIGVIGAGQMGRGIAQVAAQAGYGVVLLDVNQDLVNGGLAFIEKTLAKAVEKGKLQGSQKQAILDRIKGTTAYDGFKDCDLVVEAATENPDLKRKIFQELDRVCKPGAILGTNTSSISITWIAAVTKRPQHVIGMHFMNPVPVMQLVEIIRGLATDDATFAATKEAAEKMGKTVAEAADYPGFIVNRILMPMINEAFYALMEGVGTPEAIDAGIKLGLNHPMGPLTLADLIGLDTCLAILNVLHNGLGDPKYRPCPLLRKYVDAGMLGRKTGRGVYAY
ncbi:MAG: 3-hydroxybutyryl-CoA dehydrogenase [Myxococcales bacterium]|nr:MAG: 3-hydroxybutyryl-CoA dehydrogenase [Myxococcales bacterium]